MDDQEAKNTETTPNVNSVGFSELLAELNEMRELIREAGVMADGELHERIDWINKAGKFLS